MRRFKGKIRVKRLMALAVITVLLGTGCGPGTRDRDTAREKTVRVIKGNAKSPQMEVHYKFHENITAIKDAELSIVCIANEMVNADISFQIGGNPWQLIQGAIPAVETQYKEDKKIYLVKQVWHLPDTAGRELKLKVEVTAPDGRKTAHEITVDYTIPASKVTFDPFSLGKE